MFEYCSMSASSAVRDLQQRITEMQVPQLGDRSVPTRAELASLLPGGALMRGCSYSVHGSLALALALIAGASASGMWCGAVGFPDLGLEAAAALGIALERFVLVPRPGERTLGAVATLSEVLSVVLTRTSAPVRQADADRVAARLRERGAVLICVGDWPHPTSTLRVTDSRWQGLGTGRGILAQHTLTVQTMDRRGPSTRIISFDGGKPSAPRERILEALR